MRERLKTGNVGLCFERSSNDWEFFKKHDHLPQLRRVVRRVANGNLDECVRFIYCPRNRQITTNGSKEVMLGDGTSIMVSQVKRRTSERKLYK